jgi:hypothetical protein
MSQELQRFPIQPREIHAGARSSNRIHGEAGEQGRDQAAQQRRPARPGRRRGRAGGAWQRES